MKTFAEFVNESLATTMNDVLFFVNEICGLNSSKRAFEYESSFERIEMEGYGKDEVDEILKPVIEKLTAAKIKFRSTVHPERTPEGLQVDGLWIISIRKEEMKRIQEREDFKRFMNDNRGKILGNPFGI